MRGTGSGMKRWWGCESDPSSVITGKSSACPWHPGQTPLAPFASPPPPSCGARHLPRWQRGREQSASLFHECAHACDDLADEGAFA